MATVIIKRGSGWVDHLRAYIVWINGEKVGRVRDGQEWRIHLSSGNYTIRFSLDWARTESIHLA